MVVFNPLCPVRFTCIIVFTFAFLFRIKLSVSVFTGHSAAAGQHASKMQQKSSVMFSITAPRDVATDDVKKALDSKLEDIVYRTSVSFTDDLDASRLQALLKLQSADVKINIGQLLCLLIS